MVVLDNRRADQANNRFTKLTITLTFICIVARTFDTIIAIFNRLRLVYGWILSDDLEALLKLVRAVSYFISFSAHALDGILYYFFDKKIKGLFIKDYTSQVSIALE